MLGVRVRSSEGGDSGRPFNRQAFKEVLTEDTPQRRRYYLHCGNAYHMTALMHSSPIQHFTTAGIVCAPSSLVASLICSLNVITLDTTNQASTTGSLDTTTVANPLLSL